MEFKEVIQQRYSCKKYSARPVEAEKLDAILNAGRLAPTAKNLQEQRVYVLQSPAALAKVDALTPCRYGAPVVLAVAFDRNNVFTYPGGKRDSGATAHAHYLTVTGMDDTWLRVSTWGRMCRIRREEYLAYVAAHSARLLSNILVIQSR